MSIQYLPIFLLLLLTGLANAQPVTPAPKAPNSAIAGRTILDPTKLQLASVNAMIVDMDTSEVLYTRNPDSVVPIASVTKLMTAMVVLDDVAHSSLDEWIAVDISQTKELKDVFSHVRIGSQLGRRDMLLLALMSSENRAAATLAHHYSGGYPAFIKAMNAKAKALGMNNTRYVEPTGLSPENVSTPRDLSRLIQASSRYPLITQLTTTPKKDILFRSPSQSRAFYNTNPLVRDDHWTIETSKTGFTDEAGRCLVLRAKIQKRNVAMVLLDSLGKHTHIGDAGRVRRWLETGNSGPLNPAAKQYVQRRQKILMASKAQS